MQRYFIKNNYRQNDIIIADDSMHKHITKVMRMEKGEHVICIDENQNVFLCEILDTKQGLLQIKEELDEDNELDVDVTLIYGLPKSDKFEFVIQKATELGVKRIVPLRAARSIVKMDEARFNKKKERFERIAQEASEQCHRSIIPEITPPIQLSQLSDYLSEVNVVAYEEESKNGEHHAFSHALDALHESITIIVGPEGGFDIQEIEKMKEMGVVPCSIGNRILRSETAPLYMLSVIGYRRELGD